MMKPKTYRKSASLLGFARNFKNYPQPGAIISNFRGEYTGGFSGTVHCELSSGWKNLGDNVHTAPVYFGFSFADTCPNIADSISEDFIGTFDKSAGWYYYNKIEWWPAWSGSPDPTPPGPETVRKTIGYEHFWTYNEWRSKFYGMIANGANWVAIGTKGKIFATGEIVKN